MTWLRLQWRGALVALVAWAGLAAAQSSGPQSSPYLPTTPMLPAPPAVGSQLPPINSVAKMPPPESAQPTPAQPAQRLVTLNENGKTIRCRLVQSWLLADGTTAHQLQALDTSEYITILDDATAPRTAGRGLPMRIFHWGLFNRVPPPGVPSPPIPPQLMVDSGVAMTRELNAPPAGANPLVTPTVATNTGSPYTVGIPTAGTPAGPLSSSSTPAGASLPSAASCGCDAGAGKTAATCGACLPDPTLVQSGPAVVESRPAPTLREKLASWFSRKPSTPSVCCGPTSCEPPNVAVAPAAPQDNAATVAATQPAPQVQPVQAPAVAPLPNNDVIRGAAKANTGAAASGPVAGVNAAPVPGNVAVSKASNPGGTAAAIKPGADSDVLADPEKFMPNPNRMKLKGLTTTANPPVKPVTANPPVNPVVASGGSTTTPPATNLPPGAASVLAARNGLDGPVAYVPIQPVVVPKPWRAPLPPDPKIPEPPELNAFVNAFTPPAPPRGAGAPQAMNSFGPMMPYPPAMAYGYGMGMPMMPPYAMTNPYPYMPQGMPYGYYPMGPTAMDAQRRYQGPLPPDPFHTAAPQMMQPVGYPQAPMGFPQYPALQLASYTEAAPAAPPTSQLGQLMDLLRNSPYPAQRELAAAYLASGDWRVDPRLVITALLNGAKQDPAPTVRAGCITNLMRMNVTTAPYRAVLEELRTDADPRVRDAAEAAIMRLGQVQTTTRAN